jgi:hypothetical protein
LRGKKEKSLRSVRESTSKEPAFQVIEFALRRTEPNGSGGAGKAKGINSCFFSSRCQVLRKAIGTSQKKSLKDKAQDPNWTSFRFFLFFFSFFAIRQRHTTTTQHNTTNKEKKKRKTKTKTKKHKPTNSLEIRPTLGGLLLLSSRFSSPLPTLTSSTPPSLETLICDIQMNTPGSPQIGVSMRHRRRELLQRQVMTWLPPDNPPISPQFADALLVPINKVNLPAERKQTT